jgi:uncharacterized protein YbjT (DUF2867 family)
MILATGATGTVDSQIVRHLVAAGHSALGFARAAEGTGRMFGPQDQIAVGDPARPETLDAALAGVQRIYLLTPVLP